MSAYSCLIVLFLCQDVIIILHQIHIADICTPFQQTFRVLSGKRVLYTPPNLVLPIRWLHSGFRSILFSIVKYSQIGIINFII